MSKQIQICIPRGYVASFTSDAVTTGSYVRLPNPGGAKNVPIAFVASTAYNIGPFNETYNYAFNYNGTDLSITQGFGGVLNEVRGADITPDTDEINKLDGILAASFTPVLAGISTAGAGTYSVQVGYYQVFNKMVTFTINLVWSAHTGTGNLKITGLPVASRTDMQQNITFWPAAISTSATGAPGYMKIASAATEGSLNYLNAAAETAVGMDTAGSLYITGSYFID